MRDRTIMLAVACLLLAAAGPPPAPAPDWQQVDAHTFSRAGVKSSVADWYKVDAHRWRLAGAAAEPRSVASR